MQAALRLQQNGRARTNVFQDNDVAVLALELESYRRKAEFLTRMNDLHRRLSSAVEVAAMIESYSVWLSHSVSHELIAYADKENDRIHLFCSSHGPDRRFLMETAAEVLDRLADVPVESGGRFRGLHIRAWKISSKDGRGRSLVLMRPKEDFQEDEIRIVDDSLSALNDSITRAIGYEDLFLQARVDSLTGLSNRRVFDERISPMIDNAARHGHNLTLATMDLDKFKQVNDTLGHAAGDRVLQKVAGVFSGMIRSSDLLVRMGGDEFILVLPDTEAGSARMLTERLIQAVHDLNIKVPGSGRVGVSIGLAQWSCGQSEEEWLQQADEALYKAKAAGGSTVTLG